MAKKSKKYIQAHTDNVKHGMGDYYGSGVRNPVGKIRDVSTPGQIPVSKGKLKKAPRSLA